MKKQYVLLALILGLLVLTACAPKPQDYAEADLLRVEAQATATAAALNAQYQQLYIDKQRAENEAYAAGLQAAQQEVSDKVAQVVNYGGWVVLGSLSALCIGLVFMFLRTGNAVSKAVEHGAMIRAVSIKIDPKTGSYPALLLSDHIHNPNTHETMQLGAPCEASLERVKLQAQKETVAIMADAARDVGKTAARNGLADAWNSVTALPQAAKNYVILGSDDDKDIPKLLRGTDAPE